MSSINIFAKRPLNSSLGNVAIVVVVPIPAFTLTPVRSTLPIEFVPIPVKSVVKSVFNILISWSFSNSSSGVKIRFLLLLESIIVENSPSSNVVKSVVFSSKYALLVSVKVTNSDNWVSNVSGSIICIK